MRLNPYLSFNGDCADAFAFYERVFGAKTGVTMRWGDGPMAGQAAPEMHDKIMHTQLDVGGVPLMGSDAPPGRYSRPDGLTVSVIVDDPLEADRIFGALSEGGEIGMPIAETFWAQRFGMVRDRFGIPWMVNCEKQAS